MLSDETNSRTDRPPVTAKLAGSAELARLLLNSTGEGIYGLDLDGNCTFANPACLWLLGFESDAELLGRNMHALVHHTRPNGDPYPIEQCRIYQALQKHEETHVDDELMFRSDGSSFPVEYWSYPVERDGELVGCVITFVDISERRRNEQLLAGQAADLAEVARFPDMNPGPVLRVDLEGIVLRANRAAREVCGDEFVGAGWQDICPGIDEATWRDILDATGPVALERRIGDREFVFTHSRDSEHDLVFVFGADITEQKTAEQALQARNAELEHELKVAQEFLREARDRVDGPLLGDSVAVRGLREAVEAYAATDETLLLAGPPGAGQEAIARATHHQSNRGSRPFIYVNCALLHTSAHEALFGTLRP